MAAGAFAPVVLYAFVRPHVSSDALALMIAGAIPTMGSIALVVWRRRVNLLALVSAGGFMLACLISLLAGSSALPLKLPEAPITSILGIGLLIATLIRRPPALGRLLGIASASTRTDSTLAATIGGFLVLHASLVLSLALVLPTGSYLVLSRIIGWGTLLAGGLALSMYLRRLRAQAMGDVAVEGGNVAVEDGKLGICR